jgi:sugar phosphate isomerase/epimerase
MKLDLPGAPHLTYCTNIHAGESWREVEDALRRHVVAVKRLVSADAPFGVGLRLSARAISELEAPEQRDALRALLAEHGLYVFTINGFPYGNFHGTRVKESVYEPRWSTRERGRYTLALAHLLAELLPDGVRTGSISTLPLGFRGEDRASAANDAHADQLVTLARILRSVELSHGKRIVLALEPEPECILETTEEAVRFLEERVFLRAKEHEAVARAHLGVCLDACHAAVELEEAKDAVDCLERAGIAIAKIQLTNALEATGRENIADLVRFAEDTYLHQCVVRRADGRVERYLDLPRALRQEFGDGDMLRTHFHVPVFAERLGRLSGTQGFLRDLLAIVRGRAVTEHLEVETYTWDVLPPEHRRATVMDDVAREIEWVRERLA